MSALLAGFEDALLGGTIIASIVLASTSILTLLLLFLRRLVLEVQRRRDVQAEAQFDQLVSAIVWQRIDSVAVILPPVAPREVAPLVRVLLSYLRNLVGPDAERLIGVIEDWNIENLICAEARQRRRGRRILALSLLSYLKSRASLDVIFRALDSDDPYIQLAAMRCMARRGAAWALSEIVHVLEKSHVHNPALLADALQRFGPEGVPELERLAAGTGTDNIRAAALEAIALIEPEQIALDPHGFMSSESESVRAAAVRLAGAVDGESRKKTIEIGIADRSALVRAEAAAAIGNVDEAVHLASLSRLFKDPDWWVRYRASQAMLAFGAPGRALMRAISQSGDERSAEFARTALAEAGQV